MLNLLEFDTVVFSGGGSRCLWQAGFWDVISRNKSFSPTAIAATSAGATIACLLLAGRSQQGLSYFKQATALNRKNVYWANLFRGSAVFPHYAIYKKAIFDLFDDSALARLKDGPEIKIQIAHPPNYLGPRSGALIGMLSYSLEKLITYPMHPVFNLKLGYRPLIESVNHCKSVSDLVDLLLQSSCTPPFVPVMQRNGKPALDGGLVDNVPINVFKDRGGKTLVLLSRRYPENKIPHAADRTYMQPSQPITISKWDYTNPEGLQHAYDLGIKDAEKALHVSNNGI